MACRITELVLDTHDPEALARWWCAVLDYRVIDREDDGSVEIGSGDARQPTIVFGAGAGPKREKLRLHIDVNATDREPAAELERLLELGAKPVDIGQTGDEGWHVLSDPEGNEFCLLGFRVQPLPTG
ncbi:VOC family protein [Pseudonocardia humida]|uniref:VOC family protein n=1 Tax=Pseudonocardia humida TaxID=2800819 RepID=A0ABT1A8V2_9PSEU|nr:VOC family protein [Pseudonocardia humida]MCO1659452.1 VOC family protein [Pseudonocardia humida]